MLYPVTYSSMTAIANDSGIEIITITDARVPNGSSVMSTSSNAMAKSSPNRAKRVSTFWD